MNKLFTKIAALALGATMAVGVGVAVASNSKANSVNAAGVDYTLTISTSDFNTTSYAANNNEKTSDAVCSTDSSKKYQVKWTSNQIMQQSSVMQWQKSKGYIYNSTDLGTIKSVTVNSSAGSFSKYYGTSKHPTSGTTVGNGYFTVQVGGATGKTSSIVVVFTIEEGDTAVGTTTTVSSAGSATSINLGGTLQLSSSVKVTSTSEVISGAQVTYSSGNTSVATVNASTGLVTASASKTGNVTITANYDGVTGQYKASSGNITLKVVDPNAVAFDAKTDTGNSPLIKSGISFACDSGVLNNGSEYRLYKNSNTTISVSSGKIKQIDFICTSGNPASGFASQTGWTTSGDDGTWTGSASSVTFTASGAQVRATTITVTLSAEPSIEFATASHDILIGEHYTQTATTSNIGTNTVSYSSGTPSVATVVSSTGEVTGVAEGPSVITASVTVSGTTYTATYTINVTSPSVSFDSVKNVVFVGQNETTTATAVTGGVAVAYSSGTPAVATVDSSTGQVTGVAEGTSVITASATVHGNVYSDSYTLTVRGENTPYTVAQARAAIDNGFGTSDVYVAATVSQVDSFNTSDNTISYWISDDGTTTNQFKVHHGKDADGANFSSIDDVLVGDDVVVRGNITLFNTSTYEFTENSQRVSYSRITITSISVKTAPTKTVYKSGDSFDPTGLEITVNYSEGSPEDVTYLGNEELFSFSPSTITAAGNVEITYKGAICYQAVTLATVVNVTGVASAPSQVYQNGSISPSEVTLNVTYSDSSTGTVTPDSVSCVTTALGPTTATATYNAATGTKTAEFNVTVVKVPTYDYINDEITTADCPATSTTYVDFTGLTKASGAVYAGNTAKDSKGLVLRSKNSNSGIVSTSSPGVISKIIVVWDEGNTSPRSLDIYGKSTAYSQATDLYDAETSGTKLGSIDFGTSTEFTVTGDYEYVGIRSNDGACYFHSITFTWKVEGASDPLDDNPELSTGDTASVSLGKSIALSVTTSPVDSDEKLIVTVDDETVVSVTGSGKNYVIRGLALGSTTVTVAGAKGVYSSSVTVTVTEAVKTYEDKVIYPATINVTGASYADNNTAPHDYDGVSYNTYNVQLSSNAFQLKKSEGYIQNSEVLYSKNSVDAKIKAITLFMSASNQGSVTVYEGTSAGPSTAVSASVVTGDVVTYTFSSNMTYFKILETGGTNAAHIDKFVIELADDTDTVLSKARSAASAILTNLSGLCGAGGSGMVTQEQWNTINSALEALNLDNDTKLLLKNADRILLDNLSQGSVTIENAMAHYDACVEKFGYTPFGGITNASPSGRVNPISIIGNTAEINTVAIVVVTSVISLTAIGGYFFLRKRREQN